MKRSTILFIFIGVILASSAALQVQGGWPNDAIYVQETEIAPKIDGIQDVGEWDTDEETFEDSVSNLSFDDGTINNIIFTIVVLRDQTNVYFLIEFKFNDGSNLNYVGNASVGIALSDQEIGAMASSEDRKIIYNNASSSLTETYDLHNCDLSICTTGYDPTSDDPLLNSTELADQQFRDQTPGKLDTSQNLEAAYGDDGSKFFFEISFPLIAEDVEDITIQEGTNFKIVMNPYRSLWHEKIGHGGVGSKNLEITFEKTAFFERPEGPMDGLSKIFTGLFSLIIIGMSLLLLISARNDKFAEKFLRVNITEKMANESVLMEIGYYNSSFISLFSLFYFWLLSLITVVYGWWANWAFAGILINGPALIISTYTMYDLIKRNHNPQDIPEEEKRKLGRDVEETNALWIFPPLFLGLVLFMLVFIGIDVIT